VGTGVFVWVGVEDGMAVSVRVGVGVGVRVPSGVNVAVGVSVFVDDGTGVRVGRGVHVGVIVAVGGGGKSWFATGSPNKADATANENNTIANASHCQPASMYARRVR